MSNNDKLAKLEKEMKKCFTYIPPVPNIMVILQGHSIYTIHKADLINIIYPAMEELNPKFDKDKYAEAAKDAYFSKLELMFNEEGDHEDMTDAIYDCYNIVNDRLNYIHSQFDANEDELSKDLAFMVDFMELTYTASRYVHTYIYSIFECQVYIDKELDVAKNHSELDEFVSLGFHIINYMFKRTFMYEKGEILYGKELADEYVKDMYNDVNNDKMLMKEVLSFCLEKSYISEEIHNDILDVFQSIDNSNEEVVYN
jgi:hypothetical protein|nr:MAG TPA: hypothetical protein [Caudoviricetes sp.]